MKGQGKHADIIQSAIPSPLLYKLRIEQLEVLARRRERQRCMARHMQACLVLRQFEIHIECH